MPTKCINGSTYLNAFVRLKPLECLIHLCNIHHGVRTREAELLERLCHHLVVLNKAGTTLEDPQCSRVLRASQGVTFESSNITFVPVMKSAFMMQQSTRTSYKGSVLCHGTTEQLLLDILLLNKMCSHWAAGWAQSSTVGLLH